MSSYLKARRVGVPIGIAALSLLATASLVSAHAQYQSSTPAANATVQSLPSTLQITYSEELAAIQITVTAPDGSNATTGSASIDLAHRTNASIGLRDAGPGTYTVVWHNVSGDDGDPNDGSFVFTEAGASAQAQPAPAPPAPAAAAPAATAANAPAAAAAAPACIDNGVKTPGIADVRVDTYCKRQAIRDKFRGQIDEKTFNYALSIGEGLETALADAMDALKSGAH